MPKAVVDHNVFIAGLLSSRGTSAELIDRLRDGEFRLIYAAELVAELREVLSRPKIREKYGITRREINGLLKLLRARGRRVKMAGIREWCRDPDDNILCEVAIRGKANYLVANDDDLLGDQGLVAALLQRYGVRVVMATRFLHVLRSAVVRVRRRRSAVRRKRTRGS